MRNSFVFNLRRFSVEFVIFSVYAVFSMSWSATGSLMPLIAKDLSLNTQQATLITSMIIIAKIFGASLKYSLKNIPFSSQIYKQKRL